MGDAFLWLRQLRTKPAAALAAAADAAGVPAVEALYAALPRPMEDRLDGWIDGHLLSSQAGGVSFTHRIDQIIAIGERVLGEFGLDTSLMLLGQEATHTLVAVRFFPPPPLDVVVIPRLDPPDAVPSASARLTSQLRVTGSRAHTLTLGPHDFTLPYGRYAWPAFNKSLHAASGSELAALMAMTIDCAAMAEAVATKCVGPACVGHREELRGVCEGGRDRIVADLQARVEQSGFDMIAIKRGTAVVTDSGGQSMSDGVWTMAVNTGSGLRPVPGVFSGAKVAAVPGLR